MCSSSFDMAAALSAAARSPADRMIADVLLDQSVLPGCGNIIKNDALHRAAVDPNRHFVEGSPCDIAYIKHSIAFTKYKRFVVNEQFFQR